MGSESKEASGPDALVVKARADEDMSGKEKKKVDWSDEARVEIPAATHLARSGKLDDAVAQLLALEKRARLGGDTKVVGETALVIVKLCFELNNLEAVNANITLLCKRRGQFKQVQTLVIQEAAERVAGVQNKEEKLKLITTLRAVSEGKIYVEAERARLTKQLAQMREADGDVAGAADVLQEENVETYGAMNKYEKLDFLLEQIRLCLAKKDFIRALIISKKVNRKQLEEADLEALKLRFYGLMIEYYTQEKEPLELARSHLAIYKCAGVQADTAKWVEELKKVVLWLAMSPFDNHQIDLVHNVLLDDKLDQIAPFKKALKRFVTDEIAQWPLSEHSDIGKHDLLRDQGSWTCKMLRDRVVEHDIRVVAKCYTQVRLDRLAELMRMNKDEVESYISRMVTSSTSEKLIAKIDRPSGIVSFKARRNAEDYLTDWSDNIGELLGLVEKTCHLIHKEVMIANSAKEKAT